MDETSVDENDSAPEEAAAPAEAPVVGPVIEVLGDASPEQIAALAAVLSAASGGDGDDEAPARHTGWVDRARLVRAPLRAGVGGWRASALPR